MTYSVFGGTLKLTQSVDCVADGLRCVVCLPVRRHFSQNTGVYDVYVLMTFIVTFLMNLDIKRPELLVGRQPFTGIHRDNVEEISRPILCHYYYVT